MNKTNVISPSFTCGAGFQRREKGRRIALYSHDAQGLGHLRRNIAIATALAVAAPEDSILLVAGTRQLRAFTLPPNVDCVILPSVHKEHDGQYSARSLGIPLQRMVKMRAKIIHAVLESFAPHVLIADKHPLGLLGELKLALETLRLHGKTRCILGLREVLDDPATVHEEWGRDNVEAGINTYYDRVFIYGDRAIYDTSREYGFSPELCLKMRHTGYLCQCNSRQVLDDAESSPLALLRLPPGKLALCLLGGGQDGEQLAEAFAQALLPPATNGIILAGPFMEKAVYQRVALLVAQQPRMRFLDFTDEPFPFLDLADHVIAMGGYNTVCEIAVRHKRALIVPRVTPRKEQLIRAERLRDFGFVDMLHPADLSPAALSRWLSADAPSEERLLPEIDFYGLDRIAELISELMESRVEQRVMF